MRSSWWRPGGGRPVLVVPVLVVPVLVLALVACTAEAPDEAPPTGADGASDESPPPAGVLRDLAGERLAIGVAVAGGGHHEGSVEPISSDEAYQELVAEQFGSLTPENQLKWEFLRPDAETFGFAAADAIVEFAEAHGQEVRGHTLLWHSQVPEWVEGGGYSPDELRDLLHEHITTVVGRYAGRIDQWDVVNEVVDDDGNLRTEENIWLRELGPGIIADAFRWAHEADPQALLFANDFSVESAGPKADAYHELLGQLLDDGVPVDGFGVQGHLSVQYGFPRGMADNLQRFADLGLQVAVTEADVRVPLGADGATEADLTLQADYFAGMLEACLAVARCTSFTMWGLGDGYSWVPSFFDGEGAALLFDEELAPKPAHAALADRLTALPD